MSLFKVDYQKEMNYKMNGYPVKRAKWVSKDVNGVHRLDALDELRTTFDKLIQNGKGDTYVTIGVKYENLNWRSGINFQVKNHRNISNDKILYDGDGSIQLDTPMTKLAGNVTEITMSINK
jgi:hypothetical protein